MACGRQRDCAPLYSAAELNKSAARWDAFNATEAWRLQERRMEARRGCSMSGSNSVPGKSTLVQVLNSGGWCLASDAVPESSTGDIDGDRGKHPRGYGAKVDLPNGQSYRLTYSHVRPDVLILAELLRMLSPRFNPLLTERASILDFGAGVGQYGHTLLSLDPRTRYAGFDGAGDVEQYTRGFVRWFDLTMPLSLPRASWVLALEVGEHIPREHEGMVLRNIHAHNCRGAILSWAALRQGGAHHVNKHQNSYVVRQMQQLGYYLDEGHTARMRGSERKINKLRNSSLPAYASVLLPAEGYAGMPSELRAPFEALATVGELRAAPWFRHTVMVFVRHRPQPGCG